MTDDADSESGIKHPIETHIGTSVVTTSKHVVNPKTGKYQDMSKLSPDGYCRKFLALHQRMERASLIDVSNAPILTFPKDKWELRDDEDCHILVKRDPETRHEEQVLGSDHE